MGITMHIRLLPITIGIAVLAAGGLGAWWALRNPVADVPRRSLSPPTDSSSPQQREHGPRPAPPSDAYVGSAVCAECHPDICESYRKHPMGRSLARVLDADAIEDYQQQTSFQAPPSTKTNLTFRYYVERKSDGVYHHEQALTPDGDVLYDQAVPVQYAVGSGIRGRSYITNRDGILLMSPITWYTQKNRWDFSPGYLLNNQRFERRITDGCITCHAGRVTDDDSQQPNRYAPEPFGEMTIGCERCHGPAREHVAIQSGTAPEGQIDTIVNPADLEPRRRDSVCFQCHFQGEHRIPRYGRSDFDFRPGDLISDIWTVFVRGTKVDRWGTTEAVSQVEQMLSSECYRESGGRLGCISCHDPHSTPSPEERVAFYRSRCLACHGEGQTHCALPEAERLAATKDDSCIDCHMPPIKANDVPHTSQTDHRILKVPHGNEESTVRNQTTLKIFGEDEEELPPAELDRARGLLLFIHAERRNDSVLAAQAIPLLEKWLQGAPDDESAAEALGAAYWMNRDQTQALAVWKHGLEVNPENENILRRLMQACHDAERFEDGIEYGRRLVELNRWYADPFARLAHMYGRLGRFKEGIQAARRSVELNPAAAVVHGWLSDAYSIVGNETLAKKHRTLFEELRPRGQP